jgi:hypothetical protein
MKNLGHATKQFYEKYFYMKNIFLKEWKTKLDECIYDSILYCVKIYILFEKLLVWLRDYEINIFFLPKSL